MSSVGQAAGYIVGGIVGWFVGYPMLGAAIGGAIGGYIDPPKGQDSIGPRLEDLTAQTSTYGAILPRVKGTIAVTGNVFWLEGDKLNEHKNTKKVGGKGGPTAKQTTFNYTATFAVGLSHQINGPIKGIKRLWLANQLVYDAGSGDIESIVASNQQAGILFKFYDGRDDQEPDPRMQADKGVANVSGYPGRCYIVFYDLDLTEKYNNTLMTTQVKVELTTGTPSYDWLSESLPAAWGGGHGRRIYSAKFDQTGVSYCVINHDGWTGNPTLAEFYRRDYGVKTSLTLSFALTGYINNPHRITVCQGDEPMGILLHGWSTTVQLSWVTASGVVYSPVMAQTVFPYLDYSASVKGADTFLTYRMNAPIYKFSSFALVATSSASYKIKSSGLSESYLFGVYDPNIASSSTTVYKFSRADLSLVSTYTQSVPGTWAAINVIDDDTFFTLTATTAYKWVGGVVVASYPGLFFDTGEQGEDSWFSMVNESPVYAAYTRDNAYYDTQRDVFIGYETLTAGVAKLHDIVLEECELAGISSADIDLTELTNSDVRGYRAASTGSVRSILEQLQAAFPFDVLQSGYKIKFKDRGGASVLTVPEADLGAHTGNDTPSRFMLTTEMPSQVPAKVTFNFLNADREYDPDEQSASFTAQEVKNSYTVSLPLVMTPTEALQAADVLLKKEQRERTVAGTFWLPPKDDYRKLEAADVIDVVAQGRTHTIRLTKVSQLPDGRIECDGKLTSSAAYASTAQAQDSLALGQSGIPLAGPSELLLLDIPRVVADQDVPGIALGMYGYTAGWSGGLAFRSDDSGQSYAVVTSFLDKTEVFTATNALSDQSPYAIDHVSSLTVTPDFSGADLFSITETQLYAKNNLAAYGIDGRWEIIAFKTAIDNTGSYALLDFRRGLYGTEWASGLHVAGDKLVMLT